MVRGTAARFDEPVNDNRDLGALGFANIASAVTHGFVVNGSPPRTTASEMSGGRTQFVNVFMAGIIALILLFFSGALRYIPIAALAAVIFTIGMHLFNIPQFVLSCKLDEMSLLVAVIALLGVALLGVIYGVAIAVAVSLIDRLSRQYRPLDEVLTPRREARALGTQSYRPESQTSCGTSWCYCISIRGFNIF